MAKIAGKDLVFKLGTLSTTLATVGIFDPTIEESAGEIDVTDSSSTAKEFLAGFVGRTLTWSKWYSEDANPEDVNDTLYFSWKAGTKTFSGQLVIISRKISATREDAHRYDYTARITGPLTYA